MPISSTTRPQPGGAPEHGVDGPARWEWRWVDEGLPVARALLRLPPGTAPQTTEETYLVSVDSPHNVKIRGGVLDVKRLRRVAEDGLELWYPTRKAAFPLAPGDLAETCDAWDVPLPRSLPGLVDLRGFLDDVVPQLTAIRRVDLIKHRSRITAGNCEGEVVALEIRGERWMSLAFEDPDPDVVRRALRAVGLEARTNCSYPAALKRILGLPRSCQSSKGVR